MTEAANPPAAGTHRWVSLMACDLATSRLFYQRLFGWEYEEGTQQLGPYVRALRGGRQVAGLGETAPGALRPVSWVPYVATDDADTAASLIRDCCGTIAIGPLDVAGVGRLAIAADVCGAVFGLWQGGRARRAPLGGAHGTPVWNELITADAALAGHFYTRVFGYEALPEPALPDDVDYLVLKIKSGPVAGIRGVGADFARLPHRGAHWLTYFSVSDVDAMTRRARELGGRLLREPEDSPFGRLAWLTDPEGAVFGLVDREAR